MSKKDDTTITEKLEQLDTLITWFDGDAFELEKALDTFTKAEALATEIERDLLDMTNKITVIKNRFDKE
jgi:exonuclease VII small subunit